GLRAGGGAQRGNQEHHEEQLKHEPGGRKRWSHDTKSLTRRADDGPAAVVRKRSVPEREPARIGSSDAVWHGPHHTAVRPGGCDEDVQNSPARHVHRESPRIDRRRESGRYPAARGRPSYTREHV